MNTEKILGARQQETVSDLVKSCFSEKKKRLQKLEKTGWEEKHGQAIDTNSGKKEGNVLDVEQCQKRDLFCQGQCYRFSCK